MFRLVLSEKQLIKRVYKQHDEVSASYQHNMVVLGDLDTLMYTKLRLFLNP